MTNSLIWVLFGLVLLIAAIVGWVMNIFKIFGMWSSEITAEFVVRLVGVPIPFIGAIAGWF